MLNYPDYVVFDIDPYIYSGKEAPGAEPELNTVAFEKGKEVAFWLRELLQSMSLEADREDLGQDRPARLRADRAHARLRCGARRSPSWSAATCMRQHPKDITMEWSVPKRTGKIFMDYNMNVRGKTLNVAYSPRGVPGAPVSMPLTWEELRDGASARLSGSRTSRSAWRKRATAGATPSPASRAWSARWQRAKA